MSTDIDDEIPKELAGVNLDTLTPEEADTLQSGYVPELDGPLHISLADRRLVTQPFDFSVRVISTQIDDQSIIVQPPYQRGYVWDDPRASRLIESLLMNIPIPPCYFAEEDAGI